MKIDELIKNLEVGIEWGCRKWLGKFTVKEDINRKYLNDRRKTNDLCDYYI